MQPVNTSYLNATSPAMLPASTGPVSKNDLDTVISVADKPMHPEMTGAISELAGDLVLLAETTLALIGSDQKRQPEIDEKEALDLTRLKNLKAETEQTLKGSMVHLDFSEGAMELRLITLSLELSALIDKLLKGRMDSQKGRNEQIEVLNDLLSELRKKEKSTEAFDASTLDKPEYAVLANAKHVKEMRVISTVSPDYPYWLHLAHVEANVLVSFVVGIDGKVEDARIIESSDSRFNSSAIAAIRKFTWIPAEGAAGPEREMAIVPFYFRAPKKGT